MKNYKEAIFCYTQEISNSEEKNVKNYNNRAFCLAKLDKFADAIQDYSKVIEIEPKNTHALHNRGICLQRVASYKRVSLLDDCVGH